MKSDIVLEAENLYQSGQIQKALKYYATALWRGEENNTELLCTWLNDKALITKAGEQAVCAFIASILFTIDRCDVSLQKYLWTLCQNIF